MSLLRRISLFACACAFTFTIACSNSSSGGTSGDGGLDAAGFCRVMGRHRATSDVCASNEGGDGGVIETGCGGTFTPHDECTNDEQCASAHGASPVCACQAARGMGCGAGIVYGNVCVPANCHVDTDCTKCGECREESECGIVSGYYCATPLDECSTNADCGTGLCRFKGDHWACETNVACAG